MARAPGNQSSRRCSFCGKPQQPERRLVAGPGVFICRECVALCNSILETDAPALGRAPLAAARRPWWRRLMDRLPSADQEGTRGSRRHDQGFAPLSKSNGAIAQRA